MRARDGILGAESAMVGFLDIHECEHEDIIAVGRGGQAAAICLQMHIAGDDFGGDQLDEECELFHRSVVVDL